MNVDEYLQFRRQGPRVLLGVQAQYRDLLVDGLSLTVGLHNVLGTDFTYAQPYQGYHANIPGQPRELRLQIGYDASF